MSDREPLYPVSRFYQGVILFIILGVVFAIALPVRSETSGSCSLRDTVRTLEPSVVWILADLGGGTLSQGSGFIIHEDGYILTNAHVVAGATEIMVGWTQRYSRTEKFARIISFDSDYDLAVIKIEGSHYPAIPLDTSSAASVGDAVVALGYPAGTELGLGGITVTRGILSCIRRWEAGNAAILQTDAAVTLGCSGGPLYNLDTGTVIGVIQGKGMDLLEGFNFAIPSDSFFNFAGTQGIADASLAVENLIDSPDTEYSLPFERALDLFNNGLEAMERDQWAEALSHFLAASDLENEDPETAYAIAESYAALERPSEALVWLERAFELGYSDFGGALESEGFSEFRDDPRFVELVQSF